MKSFRKLLESGLPKLGLSVMHPSPGAIERIGPDWDWMWIDTQHGQLGYADMLALVRACDLIERAAIVRVPSHEYGGIGRALDTGASGVIVPMVNTPEEALAVVHAAKLPPLGERSYGGRRAIDLHGRAYASTANRDTLLIAQIETPGALDHVDAIAATKGVDALFLGPDDISLRRGRTMDQPLDQTQLRRDMDTVLAACRRHNKFAVAVGMGAEMTRLCASLGFHMIVAGGDSAFLANGSKVASTEARAALLKVKPRRKMRNGRAISPY